MTFTYKGKDFLLDGRPFRVISGAMHYWRIVPGYWEDRLKKLRACGFNTVETYVPWCLHERREGEFDFSGALDIDRYITLAESLGLNVIVRPGPYICSEFDLGGLPSWLLKYEDLPLRCNDPRYLDKVSGFYRELFDRVRPHLCTNGGRVIMVQIENEYGSYGDDKDYLRAVAGMYRASGIDCLLYTSDGPCFWMLNGGTLPEYPCVANFGSNPEGAFRVLSEFRPDQPSMCGEFWCGWFDHWGEAHHVRTAAETLRDLNPMIDAGASFNFYMFHGGTNFGFTNGANYAGVYQPTITSYDYGSPLSEAGDMTETYFAVRDALARATGTLPPLDVTDTPKAAYGKLTLTEAALLLEQYPVISTTYRAAAPVCMEKLGQDFGYILYVSVLHGPFEPLPLELEHIHDRAVVFLDGQRVGVRDRTGQRDEIVIGLDKGETRRIEILVENCGRINYGTKLLDRKGILGGIRLGQQYHFGWNMSCMTMDDLSGLTFEPLSTDPEHNGQPIFLRGELTVAGTPADTFIRLDGFHKGFVTVNGFNLGRYWNDKGPQKTLYVPAPLLREGQNEIIVFESDGFDSPVITFTDTPDLG